MYSTSSEETRIFWAAHTYNVAYSDEIGHFEYCDAQTGGNCTEASPTDPGGLDADDTACFTEPIVQPVGDPKVKGALNQNFTGCEFDDLDFDGPPYQHDWPGSSRNPFVDLLIHAQPVTFTSPLFTSSRGSLENYSRVAFETDLPRIEGADFSTNNDCQRDV